MNVANVLGKAVIGAVIGAVTYGIYQGIRSTYDLLADLNTLGRHVMAIEGQLEELVVSHRGMPDAQELVLNRLKIIWDSKVPGYLATNRFGRAAYAELVEKAVVLLSVDALKGTEGQAEQEPKTSPDTPAE